MVGHRRVPSTFAYQSWILLMLAVINGARDPCLKLKRVRRFQRMKAEMNGTRAKTKRVALAGIQLTSGACTGFELAGSVSNWLGRLIWDQHSSRVRSLRGTTRVSHRALGCR